MQKTYCCLSSVFGAQCADSGTICHHYGQPCDDPHNIANHQNPAHTLVLQLVILPLGLLLISFLVFPCYAPTVTKHDTEAPPGQCAWCIATIIFVNRMLNMVMWPHWTFCSVKYRCFAHEICIAIHLSDRLPIQFNRIRCILRREPRPKAVIE